MVKKINMEKAVEFIKSEYSSIYDTMIFMAFDNGRPEEEVELEVNSIDNGLKNHEQIFLNMGLMYHDPDASGYEGIVIYDSEYNETELKVDFGEDFNGYYGKYSYMLGGYGVFINKDYTVDYGCYVSRPYGHGMGSYEYYNLKDAEDWDEVKIALTKVIDELDIWE